MIKAIKIRLLPSKEQEILMIKSVGITRFAYNWGLAEWVKQYQEGLKPNGLALKKQFNNTIKKDKDYQWLREVSAQTVNQAFLDLQTAYKNFFTGKAEKPKFKSKKKSRKSFYVRNDSLEIKGNTINLEKIGKVRYKTNYKIPDLKSFSNPRCSFDGKYWYLSLAFEHNENQVELNKDLSIGIDLGVKDLAIVSNLDKPIKNINKSKEVKRLKKRLKRKQRQVSRKYEKNKEGKRFVKTNNIIKLEREIKLIHRRINNIRNNHLHQATGRIVKCNPFRIVMEDLNVKGMMKNKHLSEAISEQKFYEFRRQIEYKAKFRGIEFVLADRFFPSSKRCSCCGTQKKDLKLSERVYHCEECGLTIDRDKNASLNLAKYTESKRRKKSA